MKTKIELELQFELTHADDKNYTPNPFTTKKTSMQVEVDVPEELLTLFKNFTWGRNKLEITTRGTRTFTKVEQLQTEIAEKEG